MMRLSINRMGLRGCCSPTRLEGCGLNKCADGGIYLSWSMKRRDDETKARFFSGAIAMQHGLDTECKQSLVESYEIEPGCVNQRLNWKESVDEREAYGGQAASKITDQLTEP